MGIMSSERMSDSDPCRDVRGGQLYRTADWRNVSGVRTQQVEELRMRRETASHIEEASSPR